MLAYIMTKGCEQKPSRRWTTTCGSISWACVFRLAFPLVASLAFLNSPAAAAHAAYSCSSNGKQTYTTAPTGPNCKELPLAPGWNWLISDEDFYMLYQPASVARDGDTVRVWLETHLAAPAVFRAKPGKYDTVRAIYSFECQRREQTLIQGTYSLALKVVRNRPADQSVAEEVVPGTPANMLLSYFCNLEKRSPSNVDLSRR